MKEILISGYYGFKNSGDDALLSCIIGDIERVCGSRKRIVVLSANPAETSEIYNVRAIDRMNIFAIVAHMGNAELLISGGGTLIQDGTSTKSLMYYLGIIAIAKFFGVKTMLYANGIGPLNRPENKKRTKKVLSGVDMITLRDKRSEKLLHDIGVNDNIHVTADPVFDMAGADKEKGKSIITLGGAPSDTEYFGISVRQHSAITPEILQSIANVCDYCAKEYNLYPVIIPMQPDRDKAVSKSLHDTMKTPSTVLEAGMSINDMLCVTANMKFCMGMRLHTLIYAAVSSVPVIGLVYDPKVSGFMEYSGQDLYINVEDITEDNLKKLVDKLMSDYGATKARLLDTSEKMRTLTADNRMYLSQLLSHQQEGEKCEKQ